MEANTVIRKIRALIEKLSTWADLALFWNHSPVIDDQITLHTQTRGSITKRNGRRGSVHQAKIPMLLVHIWFMSTGEKTVKSVYKRIVEIRLHRRQTAVVCETNEPLPEEAGRK